MKRYRDPTPALEPEKWPLLERIFCAIVVTLVILGAVYLSVRLGP